MRSMPGAVRVAAVAVVVATIGYLASTAGLAALTSTAPQATSDPRLPGLVHAAPDTVATMAERGPTGPVGLVFAGTHVRDGLVGELPDPWIAVSAVDGRYRAFDGPPTTPGSATVAVAPAGDRLAWVEQGRIHLLDPTDGTTRTVPAGSASDVGDFSPTGDRLLLHDGSALTVLDVPAGEVVSTITGVDDRAARQAVWTPDGEQVTFVSDATLVIHHVVTGRRTTGEVGISTDANLDWSPSGGLLATLQPVSGVRRLQLWQPVPEGTVALLGRVGAEGTAMRRLLGFTDEDGVAVTALRLDTGTVEQVLELPLDGEGSPTPVSQFPPAGENWVGSETVQVAAAALAGGSRDFDDPRWPWSHVAKLVASGLLALFGLGLYLTRPPRTRTRTRRPATPAPAQPNRRPAAGRR